MKRCTSLSAYIAKAHEEIVRAHKKVVKSHRIVARAHKSIAKAHDEIGKAHVEIAKEHREIVRRCDLICKQHVMIGGIRHEIFNKTINFIPISWEKIEEKKIRG